MLFNIDHLPNACKEGLDEGRLYLKSNHNYTLKEALATGLPENLAAWLLYDRAENDKNALSLLIEGTKKMFKKIGIPPSELNNRNDCETAISQAIIYRMKTSGERRLKATRFCSKLVLDAIAYRLS